MNGDVGFSLRFEPDHFVEARFSNASCCYAVRSLNSESDVLGELLATLTWLRHQGPYSQAVLKWRFVGESWIVLDRRHNQLVINIAEFDEVVEELPGETWIATHRFKRVGFHHIGELLPFIAKVVSEFGRLYEELGASGYLNNWGFDYPGEAIARLR